MRPQTKLDESFDALLATVVAEEGYERSSEAFNALAMAGDYDYVVLAQWRAEAWATSLGTVTGVLLLYKNLALEFAAQVVSDASPLTAIWAIGTGWSPGSSGVEARADSEASTLAAHASTTSQRLGDALQTLARRTPEATDANYLRTIAIPAMLQSFADPVGVADSLGVYGLGLDLVENDILDAPTINRSQQQVYIVQDNDSLETVAYKLLGSTEAWGDLAQLYGLSPPYFAPEERPGCLYPGARMVMPNASLGETSVDLFGKMWAVGGTIVGAQQQWDILQGDDGDLLEVAGIQSLENELSLRLTQPLGDWLEPDVANYGVPVLHGKKSRGDVYTATVYAEAAKDDPRVADAIPKSAGGRDLQGVEIADLVILPRSG